jgi:hypothetical protein
MIKITRAPIAAVLLAGLLVAGCGSSSSHSVSQSVAQTQTTTQSQTQTSAGLPPAVDELSAAEKPSAAQFPPARGHSLQQLATLVKSSAQLGAATGTFTPGGNRRFAFALNAHSGAFIYAPTAIYIARTPSSPAKGPFLAPADPMTVQPAYRSKQNTGPGGIKAIYAAHLPVPSKGTWTVLSLTRTPSGLIGAPGQLAAAASSPIPDVGSRPPAIATDTAATVGGNTSLLTTRIPAENMAQVSFKDVLGKRPVVLLFSTPQLCISRVCGPVTDIAVQLQQKYGNRVTFIHQEVYVDNQPSKGLRPQLHAFHLETEPWLFAINRQGVIVDRLEGSFGINAVTQAIKAAMQ